MGKKIVLRTYYDCLVPLRPDQLLAIKQDKRHSNRCHVQTTIKNYKQKYTWFSVKHSAQDVIIMYYRCK